MMYFLLLNMNFHMELLAKISPLRYNSIVKL